MEDRKAAVYRQGVIVFLVLAVLTIFEFFVSITFDGTPVILLIIAFVKAGIIVNFFMHIYRLWRPEEDH